MQVPAVSSRPFLLLVEDHPLVRRALVRALEDHLDTAAAEDAEQAFLLLAERSFSAVLTDLDLPGRGGRWLLEQARVRSPNTRRFAMTGGEPGRLEELVRSGLAERAWHKPVDVDELIATLHPETVTN